jgi:hypothetical protein
MLGDIYAVASGRVLEEVPWLDPHARLYAFLDQKAKQHVGAKVGKFGQRRNEYGHFQRAGWNTVLASVARSSIG